MAASKIMIIRHAEKPSVDGTVGGVSAQGTQDPEELIVQGWQRAGALVRLFQPLNGQFVSARLATPNVIFASGLGHHSKSLRPQHTVLAVSNLLGLEIDTSHTKGDEADLVLDAMSTDGVVLIAWEHELIPTIANAILGNSSTCPQTWLDDRFDLVWVFDSRPNSGGFAFDQVPQMLLPGDQNSVIS